MEDEFAAVHGPLCRVLRVSRVLGLAPLSFKRRHTVAIVRLSNAQVYYGYLLCSIVNMMVVLGVTLLMMTSNRWVHKDGSTVGIVIMLITSASTGLVVSAASYGARRRMKYLLLMLQQLNKITILFPNETNFVETRKRTLTVSVVMLLLVSTFILNYGLSTRYMLIINPPTQEKVGILVFFGASQVQYAIIAILEVQIVLVLHTIRIAVESFNSELTRMLDAIAKGDCRNEVIFKAKECLWRIGRYYLTLCENIRRMNSQDGALLLLLVVFLVMQLLDKSYRLIIGLTAQDHSGGWNLYLQTTVRFNATMVYVVLVAVLVNACDNIQEEIKKMRVLVSELMYRGRRTGDTVSNAAGVLCEQVLLHQPIFKPLCVCALSRSLFITVITGVLTYLVTVLKFYPKGVGFKNDKA